MSKTVILIGLISAVTACSVPEFNSVDIDSMIQGKFYTYSQIVAYPLQKLTEKCLMATATIPNDTHIVTTFNYVDDNEDKKQLILYGERNLSKPGKYYYKLGPETVPLSIVCGQIPDPEDQNRIFAIMGCDKNTGKSIIWISFLQRHTSLDTLSELQKLRFNDCLKRTQVNPNDMTLINNYNCPN